MLLFLPTPPIKFIILWTPAYLLDKCLGLAISKYVLLFGKLVTVKHLHNKHKWWAGNNQPQPQCFYFNKHSSVTLFPREHINSAVEKPYIASCICWQMVSDVSLIHLPRYQVRYSMQSSSCLIIIIIFGIMVIMAGWVAESYNLMLPTSHTHWQLYLQVRTPVPTG